MIYYANFSFLDYKPVDEPQNKNANNKVKHSQWIGKKRNNYQNHRKRVINDPFYSSGYTHYIINYTNKKSG